MKTFQLTATAVVAFLTGIVGERGEFLLALDALGYKYNRKRRIAAVREYTLTREDGSTISEWDLLVASLKYMWGMRVLRFTTHNLKDREKMGALMDEKAVPIIARVRETLRTEMITFTGK